MLRYSVFGLTKERKRKRLVAATNYLDIAIFLRDHAAEMLDPSGELGLAFTVQENDAAAQFLPGKPTPTPSHETEPLTVAAAEEVKEYVGL